MVGIRVARLRLMVLKLLMALVWALYTLPPGVMAGVFRGFRRVRRLTRLARLGLGGFYVLLRLGPVFGPGLVLTIDELFGDTSILPPAWMRG